MREITTDELESIGPFSQAIEHDGTIYVSGQGPRDPETGDIVERDPATQTRQTLENVEHILAAGGASLDDVLRASVYVTDMKHYDAVNEVYGEMLSAPYPARTAVEVAHLPVDILVEIDVVAAVPS